MVEIANTGGFIRFVYDNNYIPRKEDLDDIIINRLREGMEEGRKRAKKRKLIKNISIIILLIIICYSTFNLII
jgi:hypothetical protein